jgi:two-component system response regulator ResD
MIHLLVADDEERIRAAIREYAEFEGWQVTEAADGMQAVELVRNADFDVVVLDIMMPRLDGFSACKEIRRLKDIPVLMLSARGEEYDKLFGFELGIDDYVIKPFAGKELMARLKVIVNRHRQATDGGASDKVFFGALEVDFGGRRVVVDGKPATMTPKEYDLLFHLVRHANQAITREQLLGAVWGYDYYGDDRTVDAHIKMLRSSLGPYRKHIVTLRGTGYRFDEKV